MDAIDFLSQYDEKILNLTIKLREILLENLPDILEEVDVPAKMVAYSYGKKYTELICVIIPSKKGVKLGFNRGVDLPDPNGLLEGTGQISRYVQIKNEEMITLQELQDLIGSALTTYKDRMKSK